MPIVGLDDNEKPLKARVDFHLFRAEDETRNISDKKFRVDNKYKNA